jgi:nicotinamidase-related amidase
MAHQVRRLTRSNTALLVVDFQEKLLPAIHERERVVQNAVRLVKGAGVFGLPVLVTEQYRKGLGLTVPELATAVPGFAPIEKLAFSACGAPAIVGALAAQRIRTVLLCGIEAHVCVCQTALDLLERSLAVFVASDAISSRTPENRRAGIDRMCSAGAVMVSTEMALFELLGQAGTDEFKQVLTLVK